MDKKSNILSLIKKTVNLFIPDAEVRLFGSRARSDSDSDSDYDILVISEKTLTPQEKLPLKTAVRKELLKYGIRTDVLIQSSKEIEIKKKLPGHIIRNILKEAIVL
jgi:predicted nucleotidyltransferase